MSPRPGNRNCTSVAKFSPGECGDEQMARARSRPGSVAVPPAAGAASLQEGCLVSSCNRHRAVDPRHAVPSAPYYSGHVPRGGAGAQLVANCGIKIRLELWKDSTNAETR